MRFQINSDHHQPSFKRNSLDFSSQTVWYSTQQERQHVKSRFVDAKSDVLGFFCCSTHLGVVVPEGERNLQGSLEAKPDDGS